MKTLIGLLAILGMLLTINEGSWFPIANFLGLLMVLVAILLMRRLEERRRSRPVLFIYPDERTARNAARDRILPLPSSRTREGLPSGASRDTAPGIVGLAKEGARR